MTRNLPLRPAPRNGRGRRGLPRRRTPALRNRSSWGNPRPGAKGRAPRSRPPAIGWRGPPLPVTSLPFRPNGAVVDNDPRMLIAVLRDSHDRLASLAEAISEDFLPHISYADAWTVAQVFSHIGSGAEISLLMLEAALGGPPADPDAMPAIWDTWNDKTPRQQTADCLPADDAHIKRLEGLSDAELAGL